MIKGTPSGFNDPKKAFGELVAAHQPRVRNYVRSLGIASSSVDDIAQEAFVVAYKSFDSYQKGSNFPAWVCSIALNLVRNERRTTSRRYQLLNEKVTDFMVEQNSNPSEHLASQEHADLMRTALKHCMNNLSEKNQELLNLRYQHELEPTELAKRKNMQAGTLRKHLLRVRQSLGKCIRERLGRSFT